MSHRRPLLVAASLATAMTLSLSACSGGASSRSAGDPTADGAADSPLEVYLGDVWGSELSPEEQEAEDAEMNRRIEEAVADCMTEQGFDYVPVIAPSVTGDDFEWLPDDRDWVAQYGYGISTSPYPSGEGVDLDSDPNEEYAQSLSGSEQQAYYEALHGPSPDEEAMADGEVEYDWTTAGCYGEAQHDSQSDEAAVFERYDELFEQIGALYEQVEKAPELDEADATWSQCMTDEGRPGFDRQADAQASISEAYDDLWADVDESGADDIDQAASDELADIEIDLALTDLACREKTGFADVEASVTAELEQRFIDEHEAELEALKADAERAR
jgi:hypothetical protein